MINVNTSGYYMFSSASSFDAYGYLYEHYFNPYSSTDTSLLQDDNNCLEDNQFKITAYLQSNIIYILVVTTSYYGESVQGSFSVFVKGPNKTIMNRMSMYIFSCYLSNSRYFFYSKIIFQKQSLNQHIPHNGTKIVRNTVVNVNIVNFHTIIIMNPYRSM